MKNKNRQNLGWCLNGEKLNEQTIKLRQGLGGVPMMTTKVKNASPQKEPTMLSKNEKD